MAGDPKSVKDPFPARKALNPCGTRPEGAIVLFGINGVTPNVLIITSSDVNI